MVELSVIERYLATFDEGFLQYCDKELAKINTFYAEKLAEATRKFSNLKAELYNYVSKVEGGHNKFTNKRKYVPPLTLVQQRSSRHGEVS